VETVNDKDGFVANFWRAVQSAPDEVAHYSDWPSNENDLHARHAWLVGVKESLRARLEGDPEWYDAKIAGWWCWGMSCWIGGGFCSGEGPWCVREDADGVCRLVREVSDGPGVKRQRLHLSCAGKGVQRRLDANSGDSEAANGIYQWMRALAGRLGRVRVCCGDWSRVCGPMVTVHHGLTAVFLDPPYSEAAGRDGELYCEESMSVAHDVREWAIKWGGDPRMRIALCGYEGEHAMPADWSVFAWKAHGGYAHRSRSKSRGKANAKKERIWFSPHCMIGPAETQALLFGNEN